jgi:hypothetical protein
MRCRRFSALRSSGPGDKMPCLVLAGYHDTHARPFSGKCAKLLPKVDDVLEWKPGNLRVAAQTKTKSFPAQNRRRNQCSLPGLLLRRRRSE